ncbi:unnamed protein product, partial [Symbiodinium pilosum]
AQEVLKKVLQKHNHQREKREFVTPHKTAPAPPSKKKGQVKEQLLQRRKEKSSKAKVNANTSSLDDAVASKWIDPIADLGEDIGGAIADGTGLVGDALGDAYESAADQVSFVANTVIDSVELAVDILIRGFTDWNAGCDESSWPSMRIDSRGLNVNWGRQKCWIRLMGQTVQLFDFNFGTTDLSWPEPIKTVADFGVSAAKALFTMGKEIVNCVTSGGVLDVFKCFGNKLIQYVPPLNFLNRVPDVLSEFILVFAKVASAVVKQVLHDGQSLVQEAVTSEFPAAGEKPMVHHSGQHLIIQTHSQRRPAEERPEMSSLQETAEIRDGPTGPKQVVNFKVSAIDANYQTKLITQFQGKEVDTSSCLAFAPKNKTGTNNQATKQDWQVGKEEDFIKLEPWAVPCSQVWMKKNWDKWQGYTFYSWEVPLEKCVTVTYSLSMQPVIAFVGGLQFDLMP